MDLQYQMRWNEILGLSGDRNYKQRQQCRQSDFTPSQSWRYNLLSNLEGTKLITAMGAVFLARAGIVIGGLTLANKAAEYVLNK